MPPPILTAILLLLPSPTLAQSAGPPPAAPIRGENLILPIPANFKPAFHSTQNGTNLQELVPQSQTITNWSELISSQVFEGRKRIDPEQFLNVMAENWNKSCPGAAPGKMFAGHVNGYPIAMTFLRCPLNPSTGKPENALVRVISGNDSLYDVQYAFRYDPVQADIVRAARYLATTQLCDTRDPSHPCPGSQILPPRSKPPAASSGLSSSWQ